MGWLDKLFGNKQDEAVKKPVNIDDSAINPLPGIGHIRLGRYTDNNKTLAQTENWYAADACFKEKNYTAAFDAFFKYVADPYEQNLEFYPEATGFRFSFTQGSKRVHGHSDGSTVHASATLAVMETPGTAVMRRLLEMNYSLYYSHSAIDDHNNLCMVFITDVQSATPSKLYFGLKELATKADRQDDLLIADFEMLKAADIDHVEALPEVELDTKFAFFKQWINDALERVSGLNQDSFSGAIAYILLSTIYRIDFLIQPEATLLSEIEKISSLYWSKKDEVTLVKRNQLMKDALVKLNELSKAEFAKNVHRSRYTFSIAAAAKPEKVREHVSGANNDSHWYIDNKYPTIAVIINEYGLLYNQFIFSMPKVQTDLISIYMAIVHPAFFTALGMSKPFYDELEKEFDKPAIIAAIDRVLDKFAATYKSMRWNHNAISWNSLYDFGISYSQEVANLNLEIKRAR